MIDYLSMRRWRLSAGGMALVGALITAAPLTVHAVPLTLEIWKGRHQMELRQGSEVIRRFRVSLGLQARGDKERRGDQRTPVGTYYVSNKHRSRRFHFFIGISYPNADDAERGYSSRLIDADEWSEIFLANVKKRAPTSRTRLGGRIGIHGYGGRPLLPVDWTDGCLAVSNDDVEFLYHRLPLRTPVIIHE